MIYTQPVYYEFEKLEMPVLLLLGQRDRTALGKNLASPRLRKTLGNYPDMGKEVDSMIPRSTLIELDDLGHMPHIVDFDRFIEVLLKNL